MTQGVQSVLRLRSPREVLWIRAAQIAIAAAMRRLFSFWARAVDEFTHNAVRVASLAANPELPVAIRIAIERPCRQALIARETDVLAQPVHCLALSLHGHRSPFPV